jgi:hypothetical protein
MIRRLIKALSHEKSKKTESAQAIAVMWHIGNAIG